MYLSRLAEPVDADRATHVKHLRNLRGEEAERERLGGELPAKPAKSAADKKDGPPLLLAQSWDNAMDLSGWWMSEKLDGVRAYWDGKQFLSRQGNVYHAPDWFVEGLPETPLDGELWIDRKRFQQTVSVVRRQDKSDHWKNVRLLVFDAPELNGGFEERLKYLAETLGEKQHPYAAVHEHQCCQNLSHLREELSRIEQLGGEGLMLREPGSSYAVGRSTSLLKVKSFHDAEAVVLDHRAGKGKFKGMMGALIVQLPDGTEFSVGTGFSDAERNSPPAPGSVITFRYQELSDGGVPRFPSYVRLHTEASQKPAATPKAKSAPAKTQPPKKQKAESTESSEPRYFELSDGKSSKFWEISIDDNEVTVRYGRIGTNGTTKVKEHASAAVAQKEYDKLISEKEGKGYTEQDS